MIFSIEWVLFDQHFMGGGWGFHEVEAWGAVGGGAIAGYGAAIEVDDFVVGAVSNGY